MMGPPPGEAAAAAGVAETLVCAGAAEVEAAMKLSHDDAMTPHPLCAHRMKTVFECGFRCTMQFLTSTGNMNYNLSKTNYILTKNT